MSGKTKIQWSNKVWNPVRGCSLVSAGCTNCYAMRDAHRFSGPGYPYEGLTHAVNGRPVWTGKIMLVEDHLLDPLKWKEPSYIFTNSMSDIFHENVPFEYLYRIYAVMVLAKHHTFQNLTKRPDRRKAFLSDPETMIRVYQEAQKIKLVKCGVWPLPNVWEGVSAEDQKSADERVPILLQTPAALRWVSYEPALGPVDFQGEDANGQERWWLYNVESASCILGSSDPSDSSLIGQIVKEKTRPGLDWIVLGGESGPRARPFEIQWARQVIAQAKEAHTPVFVKQQWWTIKRALSAVCRGACGS